MEISLKCIYSCNGKYYYSIVEYNEQMTEFLNLILDLVELQDRLYRLNNPVCDFTIDNGTLRCNAMISTIPIDEFELMQRRQMQGSVTARLTDGSVYALFAICVLNDYILLDPSFNAQWGNGLGIAKAANIHFCDMAMECGVMMFAEQSTYFFKLITQTSTSLAELNSFYIATPKTVISVPNCELLKLSVNFGSEEMNVWKPLDLCIFDSPMICVGAANQACCDSVILKCAVGLCNDFINLKTDSLALTSIALIEGASDTNSAGVYFKSSCVCSLPHHYRESVLKIIDGVNAGMSDGEIITQLGSIPLKSSERRANAYSVSILAGILRENHSEAEQVMAAFAFRKNLNERLFWYNLFTYRLRMSRWLLRNKGDNWFETFFGGNTTEYTTVSEVW